MTLKRALEYRAAGGVVLDDAGRVLMIERWVTRDAAPAHEIRLPKGHVEPGETDEQAALRETCEESGYCGLLIIADLGEVVTQFDSPLETAHVHRTEHYFLMRLTDQVRGEPHFDSPDAEEARYLPRWAADLDEAQALLTFASEREFARRAATWLQVEGW
jgi:8-oxo-dGTP pyrophosphatase MutT (NUDIX family)